MVSTTWHDSLNRGRRLTKPGRPGLAGYVLVTNASRFQGVCVLVRRDEFGMIEDIVRVDWEQVRFRRAASGLLSMLAVVVFIGSVRDVIFAALMATLFVTAAGGDGTMSQRLPGMVRFSVVGAALGGLAFWSATDALSVALVLGIATYLGTLAAAEGPTAARAGLYLTIWPLFALMMGSADTEPWTVVVGFLLGGAVAIGFAAFRLRVSTEAEAGDESLPNELDEVPGTSFGERLRGAALSPIGAFAVLRTVAVVLAVVLGFWWFSSYPLWVAITVIVVVKPSANQSMSTAVQRTLGTAVGVGVAVLLAQVLPKGDVAVVMAFLASGFLMIAFNNANYTLFAAFLTSMLVFGQRLVQADALEAGWERLLATLVGALIAVAVIAIAVSVKPRLSARRDPS